MNYLCIIYLLIASFPFFLLNGIKSKVFYIFNTQRRMISVEKRKKGPKFREVFVLWFVLLQSTLWSSLFCVLLLLILNVTNFVFELSSNLSFIIQFILIIPFFFGNFILFAFLPIYVVPKIQMNLIFPIILWFVSMSLIKIEWGLIQSLMLF